MIISFFYSFSVKTVISEITDTKARPWEDRDLDIFAGFHFFSFMFTTISVTAMGFSIGWFTDLLQVFANVSFMPMAVFLIF